MRVAGTVEDTLKGGETEKRERDRKILKRGDKLGQGIGALKRRGWNPLTNYGRLGNRYIGFGTRTLVPKKHFLSFINRRTRIFIHLKKFILFH